MAIKLKQRDAINKTKAEELKKAIQTGSDGQPINFHWKNDDAKEFIDYIKDESNGLISKFRVVPMSGPTKEIAKIVDNGKFLKPGGSYKRTHGAGGTEGYEFGTDSLELVSKKIEGMIYLSDDELMDNIEGKDWEGHVMQMCNKKIANEIVEAAIYGRELKNPSGNNGILNVFDGVKYLAKKYGNVIDALTLSTREMARKTIIKAKKVLATKYRSDVSVMMDSDLKTDLDELYNDPNGNRGNGEVVKTSVSGMPIEDVPLMSSENAVIEPNVMTTSTGVSQAGQYNINIDSDLTEKIKSGDSITVKFGDADEMVYTVNSITASTISTLEKIVYEIPANSKIYKANLDGADTIISNLKNIIVGLQEDIKVEFERVAPDGWKVWYKLKGDIKIENPEAVVIVENMKSKDA